MIGYNRVPTSKYYVSNVDVFNLTKNNSLNDVIKHWIMLIFNFVLDFTMLSFHYTEILKVILSILQLNLCNF